jgi:hypothetical protein
VSASSVAYQVGCFVDGMEALRAGRRLLGLARTRPVSVTVEIATESHAGPARYAWLPEGTALSATYPAALASQVSVVVKDEPGVRLLLEPRQIDEARRNADFYIYVVENVRQGDPAKFTLKVVDGERLHRMLDRAVEHRYYEVPWPVADYDATPCGL